MTTAPPLQHRFSGSTEVEPSPHHTAAIRSSPLLAEAIAQPTACGYCVAKLPEIEKKPYSFAEYMIGSCRPLSGSEAFEKIWLIIGTIG